MRFVTYKKTGTRKKTTSVPVPVGTITAFAGSAAPSGWLLCDGASVSTTTYAALFGVVSTTYGGSGASFNLPDLINKIPVCAGAGLGDNGSGSGVTSGTALTTRTLGAVGGVSTVQLTGAQSGVQSHSHTTSETSHTHPIADHTHPFAVTSAGAVNAGATTTFQNNVSGPNQISTADAAYTAIVYGISAPVAATSSSNAAFVAAAATNAGSAHSNLMPSMGVLYIIKV